MDKIKEMLEEALKKELPNTIETIVKEKTSALEEEVKSLKVEIDLKNKEINESLKEISSKNLNLIDNNENLNMDKKFDGKKYIVDTLKFMKRNNVEDFNLAGASVKATYMNEGISTEGSELVFDQFSKDVIMSINEYDFIKAVTQYELAQGDSLTFPKATNGVTTTWESEGDGPDASKPSTDKLTFNVKNAMSLVDMTEQFLSDAMTVPAVYDMVVGFVAESQAEFLENQILNGDGTGDNFLGIYEDTTIGSISLPAGATSIQDITDADLVALRTSVKRKYKKNKTQCGYVMSEYTLGVLQSKTTTTGAILYPTLRLDNPTLDGYQVIISDKNPVAESDEDLADTKFIAFGNFKKYYVVNRQDLTLTMGYYGENFRKGIKSLKAIRRMNGKVSDENAIATLKTAAV